MDSFLVCANFMFGYCLLDCFNGAMCDFMSEIWFWESENGYLRMWAVPSLWCLELALDQVFPLIGLWLFFWFGHKFILSTESHIIFNGDKWNFFRWNGICLFEIWSLGKWEWFGWMCIDLGIWAWLGVYIDWTVACSSGGTVLCTAHFS